jgi:hypothetical protein
MTFPRPATLLRHEPPALLLDAIEAFTGARLSCTSRGGGPWEWPQLLEGAAQCAGLLAGMQPGGPANTAVIAAYDDVVVHAQRHSGPVSFVASLERRPLQFWRCQCEARDADGAPLISGFVTIARA